jgi:hypothetical protein
MKLDLRTLLASLVLTVCASSPLVAADTAKNLLAPTAKIAAWQFEETDDAKGSIKTDGDALAIAAAKIDGTEWHVQAYQAGLDLADGKDYVVTFKARASAKRSTQIYVGVNEDDYHAIGLDEVLELTPEWKTFTFTFKADGVAPKANNRLGFLVGQEVGAVWIKELTLTAK